ncbi:MAG: GNAT family protein [bacterium]|nr:GNAT family protein [bacterium]
MHLMQGERVVLRDFLLDDLPILAGWMQPHHRWHTLDGPYYADPTLEEIAAQQVRIRQRIESGDWPTPRRRAVIADSASSLMLGQVTWSWISEETHWPEIGIVIFDEQHWGKGLGYEALSLWGTYLFAQLPQIVRLDLRTWSGNIGMVKLALKLGFTQEACFRKARIVNGAYYDGLEFGVLRDEWVTR